MKQCIYCGKEYQPKYHDTTSKYCSKECRNKNYIILGKKERHLQTSRRWKERNKERTHLYSVYKFMLERCNNPNYKESYLYGGRGICVCDEWVGENGFQKFYEWAIKNGYKYKKTSYGKNELSIDRIDVNGNYEPNNCRWVTIDVQNKNKRLYSSNKTGHRGIVYYKNKYRAFIYRNHKSIHIGMFESINEALNKQIELGGYSDD